MYKSKLLNFFIRQLQRLGEGSERAFRHFKLATLWSIELLIYPIYNFFQSPKKQLKPPVIPRQLPKTEPSISHSEEPVKERGRGKSSDWLPIQIFFNFVTWIQIVPIALTFNFFSEKAFASVNPPIPAAILRDLIQHVQNLGVALVSDSPGTTLPVSRETDPFGIQSLFKAAIDYFFTREETPAIIPMDEEPENVALVLAPPFSSLPANPVNPATEEHLLPKPVHMPEVREVEYTPDWIETTAYSVGYVKHPLEVVLEWVDKALLWLEKLIVACLGWLKLVLNC